MMNRGWKQNLLAAPGIGLSLLPKIACPACRPTYSGLLSSIGLGFLVPNTAYLQSSSPPQSSDLAASRMQEKEHPAARGTPTAL